MCFGTGDQFKLCKRCLNMPYLILSIGILIAGYAIYKFLKKANAKQIAAFIGMLTIFLFSGLMIYLSLTGRLPLALGAVGAAYPWLATFVKWRINKNKTGKKTYNGNMSAREALDILGLDEDASEDDIDSRYKALMKKNHPDNDGSEYFAQKLNEARSRLLDNK